MPHQTFEGVDPVLLKDLHLDIAARDGVSIETAAWPEGYEYWPRNFALGLDDKGDPVIYPRSDTFIEVYTLSARGQTDEELAGRGIEPDAVYRLFDHEEREALGASRFELCLAYTQSYRAELRSIWCAYQLVEAEGAE